MLSHDDYKLGKQPENFLNRVTQALTRPIQSRCAELAVLFDRGTMKDLHTVFPLLVDSIFGPHSTVCWDLRTVTSSTSCQNFQALQHFLSPVGPMFKLIYTLLRDPLLKFEFGLSYLPSKVCQSMDGQNMVPFYADLICADPQTNRVTSLMLNPFDYYFFHFAYHLINPMHQRSYIQTGATWSTVYYVLCCDYVLHFLPTDPSCPVLPLLNFYNGKNPIYMLPSFTKHPKTSRLFRTDLTNNISKMQTLEHHPRNEIWRSETIMTVFIDMWLNNDQVLYGNQSFNRRFDASPGFYKQALQMNELPTGEYIRIIRVLVKQLHAFASSAKMDDTHMGELKKIVIPYLQGKMYVFLRHLVHRWPLDGSFRLVLELWLSFVQPWRYPGNVNQQEVNPDLEELSTAPMKAVDLEFVQFLAENLLTYTILLQQLLPRFNKVDLSSPKIALILYRLTKVFAQPNLVSFLSEIESCVDVNSSPVRSYTANLLHGLPPLSPTSTWSTNSPQHNPNSSFTPTPQQEDYTSVSDPSVIYSSNYKRSGKWTSVLKQKILEFEGPNFTYKPIFCANPAPEVFNLIGHVIRARATANQIVQARLNEMSEQSKGFYGFLKSVFTVESSSDEFTLEERRKVPVYLQHSLDFLYEIFRINKNLFEAQPQQFSPADDATPNTSATQQNDISFLLTPERVRERVKNIKYEGDPDLYPIRSNEVKVLVRVLYQLAVKINEDFGSQLNIAYHKENYVGRLCRQFLQPPLTIYRYEKSYPGRSPRVPQNLPPRVSLRFFASYKFLFYFMIGVALSKLFGYGYSTFVCLGVLIWFGYVCLKALFRTEQAQVGADSPRQNLFNLSNVSDMESF